MKAAEDEKQQSDFDLSSWTRAERPSSNGSNHHGAAAAAKKTSGVLETFRNSIRLVAEKSPLTPGSRGSKNQSPSTRSKAPHSPEANKARVDSLQKKRASVRRGLRFSSKKDKAQDAVVAVRDDGEDVEEDDRREETAETYTPPGLPLVPLSVMEINKLIQMEVLEEAHLHLLALRAEFQRERLRLAQADSPVELAMKEKDLSLLYADLRLKVVSVVRTSVSLPARNEGLLVHVARIVREEDKRAGEPGGLRGSWMDAWREAVDWGARDRVEGVHLEPSDRSDSSWLAVHLGLLGKTLSEDLEKVKKVLRRSYPPSFRVFAVYVRSYHAAVGGHLRALEGRATRLRDLFALLDWIVHRYRGERIMGSPALEPDMSEADADLRLDDDFLRRLRAKFCHTVEEDLRACLDRLLALENEEMWSVEKRPETDDDGLLASDLHVDICTKVGGNATNAAHVDGELQRDVIASCLRALKDFPERFDAEFRRRCSSGRADDPLWSEYRVAYINSFSALRAHTEESYRRHSPDAAAALDQAASRLIRGLRDGLRERFLDDVKPYLRRMMTRKWLTNDDDFNGLVARAELLALHCEATRPPHGREVASRAHCQVMKEYVGQLMKNKYSCKNRKHPKAAAKIRAQCSQLADVFRRMVAAGNTTRAQCERQREQMDKNGSREDWLDPVGDRLSDIVGQKNKNRIKEHLQPLLEQYPDFSARHLAALLAFRGPTRGGERRRILRTLERLRKAAAASDDRDGRQRSLFGGTEAAAPGGCLSDVSVFCASFVFPGE
ncbi:exocyst complex component 3-like protein 4 isoform X2 [Syngnathoides biaculeatus]|uniref:exocyst complex component 3-like protein 4 isoform X2 n=1 Tax=Syngnathoides biaculeatus TaxID=300417 RepID=UPI002ADDA10B|nr:exocyst complex component 3-like protein 4 isoform X2 [Syngnathoides biaculeatus]